jgi:TfoX/Sxy family transcriptional regulator of competence genes
MAYDILLENRLDKIVTRRTGIYKQKMFGGVGYLLHGNICLGIYKNDLIVRLGEDAGRQALTAKHVKPFDITGRPMKGWAMVEPAGMKSEPALKKWVQKAIDFVSTLPRK